MHYDKTRVSFYRGCGYSPEGIDKKPFATLVVVDLVPRELIDKICEIMREHQNEIGESCNVKIQYDDWDC